jgi:hypothetical protein
VVGGASVGVPIGVDVVGVHIRQSVFLFRNIVFVEPVPAPICGMSPLETNLTKKFSTAGVSIEEVSAATTTIVALTLVGEVAMVAISMAATIVFTMTTTAVTIVVAKSTTIATTTMVCQVGRRSRLTKA